MQVDLTNLRWLTMPRIVCGAVNADGTIADGSGFTVSGTVTYNITFKVPFNSRPVVIWQADNGSTQFALGSVSANGFSATTQGAAPGSFNFIAIEMQ